MSQKSVLTFLLYKPKLNIELLWKGYGLEYMRGSGERLQLHAGCTIRGLVGFETRRWSVCSIFRDMLYYHYPYH